MWSPAFLKIVCRALAFHIFKNLRLFDKKIVAGLLSPENYHFYSHEISQFTAWACLRNGSNLALFQEKMDISFDQEHDSTLLAKLNRLDIVLKIQV